MKHIRILLIVIFTVGSVCYLAYDNLKEDNIKASVVLEEPAIEHTAGVDVSRYQEDIEWEHIKGYTNVSFVYIKATEGKNHVDHKFMENLNKVREHDIPVGAYHYFNTISTSEEQFDNFISNSSPGMHDLVPMVDVESRGYLSEERFHLTLQKLLMKLEQFYGKKPLIYTGNNFYNKHLKNQYKNYYFCIANYSSEPVLVDSMQWYMWQVTDKGKLPGIKGYVDLNIINKEETLNKILIK